MVVMEALDLTIRGQLAKCLSGQETFQTFRSWLLHQTWNIEQRADLETAKLAREIELLLAEFDHGDWTEAELVEKLRPLVTAYTFRIGEPTVATSSITELQQIGFRQHSGADIRLVAEFA